MIKKSKIFLAMVTSIVTMHAQAQWTKTGAVVHPTVLTDNVSVGTTTNGANLYVEKSTAVTLGIKSTTAGATMFMDKGIATANAAFAYRLAGVTTWNSGMLGGTNFSIRNVGLNSFPFIVNVANDNMLLCSTGGNVGIGTTAPTSRLSIVTAFANDPALSLYPAQGLARVNLAIGDWSLIQDYSGSTTKKDFSIYQNSKNVHRLLIDTLGNMGIGTNTPTAKLSVVATTDGVHIVSASSSSGDTPFLVRANGGSTECMIVRANGNVGIGTTSPTDKLTVQTSPSSYGFTHTDGTVTVGSWTGGNGGYYGTKSNHKLNFFTNNGSPQITLETNGNVGIGNLSPAHKLDVSGNISSTGGHFICNNANGGVIDWGPTGSLYFRTLTVQGNIGGYVNRMIIDQNGSVAIGQNTPATGYTLTVAGKVICTELKVQMQPFPDYVFAKGYNLKSIDEVEQHINTYNRLPGMPSACEVEEGGLSVGEMTGKVVEKVEENTLYIIQLKKELDALKAELKALKK